MDQYINDFQIGNQIQGYYLIKSVECKVSNGNKKYFDLMLVDKTGEINAKLWECNSGDEALYIKNVLVKVKGTVIEWQGKSQLKIERMRSVQKGDPVQIEEYVPAAPFSAEYLYEQLLSYRERIQNKDIKKLVVHIIDMSKDQLMIYPAATHNHHAVRTGLLYHIVSMLQVGDQLSGIYDFINKDLLFAGIILHDIEKLNELDANELGIASEYTMQGQLLGHIPQGIVLIDQVSKQLHIHPEVTILLQHMLLSHHYEPEYGSPKKPMIPEAELLHYIDMMDSKMYDMKKALEKLKPCEFSEKVWTLDNRRLYKAGF